MARKDPSARPAALALSVVQNVIFYVKDTERSARWYSETLGIPARFREKGWVELETRGITLCLHGGRKKPAGEDSAIVSFQVDNFDASYKALQLREVKELTEPFEPCPGVRVATFEDPDGNRVSIAGC